MVCCTCESDTNKNFPMASFPQSLGPVAGTVLYPLLGSNNTVAGQAVVPGGFQPLRSGNGSSNSSAAVLPTTEVCPTLHHDLAED